MMKGKSSYRRFLPLRAGSMISQIGGGLTSFGLGVYVFNRTGSSAIFVLAAASINLFLLPILVRFFHCQTSGIQYNYLTGIIFLFLQKITVMVDGSGQQSNLLFVPAQILCREMIL